MYWSRPAIPFFAIEKKKNFEERRGHRRKKDGLGNLFIFPMLKRELAGPALSLEDFKAKWAGVVMTLTSPGYS